MSVTHPPLGLLPDSCLLIGSDRVKKSSGGKCEHFYAATGRPTAPVLLAGEDEVGAAVSSARAALAGWRMMTADRRRDVMLRLSALVREHAVELTALQTIESAVPYRAARTFPSRLADYLAYNAGWADKIGGSVVTTWPEPAFDYTIDEPYGVVAIVIPWNAALMAAGQLVGAAAAAGNTLVLKPSELAPFTSLRLGELALLAGFPPG